MRDKKLLITASQEAVSLILRIFRNVHSQDAELSGVWEYSVPLVEFIGADRVCIFVPRIRNMHRLSSLCCIDDVLA